MKKGIIAAAVCIILLFSGLAAMIEMTVADPSALPLDVFHALAPYNPRFEGASIVNGVMWVCPVDFLRVASPFGYRVHPIYGDWRLHRGIDLAALEGEPIYATRSGKVCAALYDDQSGNYVMIDHGDGFVTAYLHMLEFIVADGDEIYTGQLIGYVGSTGASTGPHLHFSIYYNWEPIDPTIYIDFYGTGLTPATDPLVTEPEETTPATEPEVTEPMPTKPKPIELKPTEEVIP